MSSDESIFDQALGISSPQERLAFLDRACDGNSPLRNEVEALLAAHERAGAFMQSSLIKSASRPEHSRIEPPEDLVGQTVGHYKLLERIGEGGMGVVYMAQQLRPVTRLVALKIIKPGMDSQRVIARFEAERQALAMMDHINIAKVFDAGATDAGRPYFAMELVRGIPITEHCDCHQLTPRQRLELFLQVCHAVQHAHGKGIIHRDLKPSNVLVTLADGAKPIPKIIDFGIAKATADQRLTDRTLFTEFRQLIGTPLYMSPEQAEGRRQMDIDTRSDVYSLGVLLYELLTGTTPFDKQRLAQAAYDEVRRIICEEDPPKPSMRLSTLGETITSISAQRQSDPRKLSQTVRGELDWIVMKAMEKERTRRYETANGLARDVERYLADQPVEASPPSQFYRVRKTFRRNKAAIATASALVGMLIAATVVSTWQAARATRAKAAADRSAATANQIAKSLQQMLASATSPSANGADYTVPAMLDNLAPTLDYALVDQPEAEAALRTTLGIAYHNLGDANKAAKHLARTVELQRRLSGEQHEKYADALVDYANNLKEQGWYRQWDHRGDADAFFKPAEADLRKALDVYRQRGISGERVMKTLRILNAVLGAEGRGAESEEVARQGLAVAAQSPGVEFWETATFYGALAGARLSEGKIQEAEELNAKSIAIFQRTGHQPDSGGAIAFLGSIRSAQHRFAEALEADEEALDIFRRVYPPHHWMIGSPLRAMGDTLRKARDRSELARNFPTAQKLFEIETFYWQFLPTEQSAIDQMIGLVSIYVDLSHEFDVAHMSTEAAGQQDQQKHPPNGARCLRRHQRQRRNLKLAVFLISFSHDWRPVMRNLRSSYGFVRAYAIIALLIALGMAILTPQLRGTALAGVLPPNSDAFGKTLAQWQALWLSWAVGDTAIDADANGNADVGNVVLMPLPNAAGDGTPASIDVTLNTGQGFTLPLWLNFGNSYSDGTPNDPLVPLSVFQTMDFQLTIDGKTVIDKRNVMSFYSETIFPAPGIPFDFPPAATIISCQSIGITHTPLSPGKHTMTLHAANTQALPPQYGGGFTEFNNTWNITVKPDGK